MDVRFLLFPPLISAEIHVISRSKLKAKYHNVNQSEYLHRVMIIAQNSRSY